MSLFAIALSSFGVALSGALSPGPLLAVTMSRSVHYGAKEGPLIGLGHSILELVMVVMLIFGFGYYLKKPMVVDIIGLVGGCVLILFGLWMVFSKEYIMFVEETAKNRQCQPSFLMSIFSGIIVSLSNPYWFLWWITIGLTYLSIAIPMGIPGVIAFFFGHISADLLWYSFVSFVLAKGVKPMQIFAMLIISKLCGLFLTGFGIFLIARVIV
ncbi:MAG: LysE family translocator [Candidatus Omnitrophica bacterium]|nr:LysE family translocator [Candidatus Omnitrophota bacterium]MCM8817269.1 LysE family translocator [Candidatus Omnitrophota bacterium]